MHMLFESYRLELFKCRILMQPYMMHWAKMITTLVR